MPLHSSSVAALLQTARPRQWTKNLLVIVPPLATGTVHHSRSVLGLGATFVTFCLSASGVYFINDVRDAEQDRQHDTKRLRPVAARTLTPRLAMTTGCSMLAGGVALGTAIGNGPVIAAYTAFSLVYCFALRNLALTDLLIVSSGFPLRVTAGYQACGADTPFWLLAVSFTGSLFVAAGKRYSEAVSFGESRKRIRSSLAWYSVRRLRVVWCLAAVASAALYALGALQSFSRHGELFSLLSLAPYTLALVRYAAAVNEARAGSPEDVLWRDRTLQLTGIAWLGILTTRGMS
ncbi:decaprenyl-phosphate phosphoribosyltransferase [Streptomyces sp. PA03-1a]|nr:decaprenyl-phosphate phosphoribosyltransferase [Streptomyces sp. PA03-1a]